jgi:hypothetical protein
MTDDIQERRDFIAGLRDLADFLERTREVPVPRWESVMFFPSASTDNEMRQEIDRVAALLGSGIEDRTAEYGHYTTSRYFGTLQYRAVAIPARTAAYHAARMSYSENIAPLTDGEA